MAPPNNKRPRPSGGVGSTSTGISGTGATMGGPAGGGSASRSKRKKPDESPTQDIGRGGAATGGGGRGRNTKPAQGSMDLDKDDDGEVGEGEIVTKVRLSMEWVEIELISQIDFRTLPPETLYKYLEVHELLPKWSVSPWSEDPVTQREPPSLLALSYPSVSHYSF